jgi:hypothetical protein
VRFKYGMLDTFARGMVLMNKDGAALARLYGVQLLLPF